ncbi:MAG: DUF3299 domain-containing protein [Bacteroidota bacterium]
MLRLLSILLFFVVSQGLSQTTITWKILSDVKFSQKYFEEVGGYFYYPHFGKSLKALEGKEVLLKGHILVIDPEEGFYVLSRYPFASCFFCGEGGPESIVELILKPDHPNFLMDDFVTLKGRLRLNQDDINFCNYIFEEAEIVSD